MNIQLLGLFCAYFAAAFSKEFNSTLPSQLAEKSLPPTRPPYHPPIIHSSEITRKLSTALIDDGAGYIRNLGVLLSHERVAFPESHWKENAGMLASVYCWNETAKDYYTRNYHLHYRIDENERFYEAHGIIEVKLLPEVDYECWPYTEKRYTKIAKSLFYGETVIAIGKMPGKYSPIISKPYVVGDFTDDFVQAGNDPVEPPPVLYFAVGEPLFLKEEIVGLYVPSVTERCEVNMENKFYVRLREKCIEQLSD